MRFSHCSGTDRFGPSTDRTRNKAGAEKLELSYARLVHTRHKILIVGKSMPAARDIRRPAHSDIAPDSGLVASALPLRLSFAAGVFQKSWSHKPPKLYN